jgi:hypothetical protein
MTTSFQIRSSSLLSVLQLFDSVESELLILSLKKTVDDWFRCVTLQATISCSVLVKLAHKAQLFSTSNIYRWRFRVCYFQVTIGDSAVLRSKCQENVGEFPCVGILFYALKIDLCFMSNLGSLVSCLPENGGHSLSLVLAEAWFWIYNYAIF